MRTLIGELHEINETLKGGSAGVSGGAGVSALPEITAADAGKYLRVSADGKWELATIASGSSGTTTKPPVVDLDGPVDDEL